MGAAMAMFDKKNVIERVSIMEFPEKEILGEVRVRKTKRIRIEKIIRRVRIPKEKEVSSRFHYHSETIHLRLRRRS